MCDSKENISNLVNYIASSRNDSKMDNISDEGLELLRLFFERHQNFTQIDDDLFNFVNSGEDLYTVPTGIVVLLAILYGSISLIAVIGNGLVIFVIAKDRMMQTVTNILIANLALADVIIGIFTTPFQFQPALHQRWDLPHFLCHIAPSFKVLSVSVSVLTLTVISIDRYFAVIYPLKAGFSRRYAIGCLFVIWAISIGSSFPEGYYYRVEMIDGSSFLDQKPFCHPLWPAEDFGKVYYVYLIIVQYMCPLLVIIVSYSRIACKIWGSKAPGNTMERDNLRQRNKKKVVKMLIIVVLLFVICWLPYQFYQLVSSIYPEVNNFKYINVIWFCCNWLAMSNSCYNPFIYGLLNEKFKRQFRTLFAKTRCMQPQSDSHVLRFESRDLTAAGHRADLYTGHSRTKGTRQKNLLELDTMETRRILDGHQPDDDTSNTHL